VERRCSRSSAQKDANSETRPQQPKWNVVNQHHLVRSYKFPDFKSALAFVNRVGALAEEQGHHPDILLGWGKVEITTWTHAVDGLTESDFILAAKIDQLAIKPEPENHQGHQVSRRIQCPGFPSCAFVAFVVYGLATSLLAAAQPSAFRLSGADAHPRWWWSRV